MPWRVLAEEYAASLRDLGVRSETAMMVKDRAHILAFYLQRADEGIEALEALLAENDLNNRVAAACKLTLGDIYVFQGLIWDASLLFSQIVLDFKDDPLGHEAKFRNARVSYFGGDFNWAQSQLDALKASTSKLISNDAIDLSLLITDNFNLDTLTLPMEMYARADLLRMQRKFDVARITLDSLTTAFPGHVLEDEVLMMSADMFLEQDRLDTAMTLYQEVVDLHFDDITGDDALWMLADLTHNRLGDLATAQTLYEKLLFDFPGSLHAVEARESVSAPFEGTNLNDPNPPSMVLYNVTVSVTPDCANDWVKYMMEEHIPDVLATGHFRDFRLCHVQGEAEGGVTFAVQYMARRCRGLSNLPAGVRPCPSSRSPGQMGKQSRGFPHPASAHRRGPSHGRHRSQAELIQGDCRPCEPCTFAPKNTSVNTSFVTSTPPDALPRASRSTAGARMSWRWGLAQGR